jgi:nitroreductase
MSSDRPITEIIRDRFSCRTYRDDPIAEPTQQRLERFLSATQTGPFGAPVRFKLIAATGEDRSALRGLGTYGIIRGAPAFILGAVGPGIKNLEDFGYAMEEVILFSTGLGLGTCWMGGTFQQSNFARRLDLQADESMPCVTPVGYPSERRALVDRVIRLGARGDSRLPWDKLFFDGDWSTPLSPPVAGDYAESIEMVRLGPSASNRQPWRVVRAAGAWHFYLKRTPGYREGGGRLMGTADLQRVDMGIALSHFQLTVRELGLAGGWSLEAPPHPPDAAEGLEYVATWKEGRNSANLLPV